MVPHVARSDKMLGYRWRDFVILLPDLRDVVFLKILVHATCRRWGMDFSTCCRVTELGSILKYQKNPAFGRRSWYGVVNLRGVKLIGFKMLSGVSSCLGL